MSSNSKLDGLEAWMHNNGIVWNPSTVTLCGGTHSEVDFAVVAARDVAEHDVLCEIPKEAVLSVRNSAIANLIEEEQLGGGLGLILSIMYEVSIGARSKWHAYLQSLPSREYLPLFWQEIELALLQGTELSGKADADRTLTQEDWETNILPLIHDARYPMLNQAGMNLDLFRVAASWVASRAFGVDDYHGMAMVPFADLFNHKAAVVQLGGDYFVENVCFEDQDSSSQEEEEGNNEEVGAEVAEEDDEEEDEEEEDEEVEVEEDQRSSSTSTSLEVDCGYLRPAHRRSQVSAICKRLTKLARLHDAHKPW
ncbi:TPA: hypothetical protein ACH3X2_007744 [Trebouxia sp. C0005]